MRLQNVNAEGESKTRVGRGGGGGGIKRKNKSDSNYVKPTRRQVQDGTQELKQHMTQVVPPPPPNDNRTFSINNFRNCKLT